MLSKFSEQTNDQQSETITVVMIFEGIVRVQVWRLSSGGRVCVEKVSLSIFGYL